MKVTPTFPHTPQSALEDIKRSTLDYIIDYLPSGLESFDRDPADNDFQWGYECALHDTIVDLLRCHVLARLPSAPADQ
jgi:hypothetical protein